MATDLSTRNREEIGEVEKYNFRTETKGVFKARKGIDADIVNQISDIKEEPDWMREFRLKALEIFESKPMPTWGGDIDLDFQDIFYYLKPTDQQGRTWDDVPEEIKDTFERLGIPEAERKFLSGVKAQFESEVVYGSLEKDLADKGVIFTDTDTAVREHPELLREYFGKIIPSRRQQVRGAQLGRLVRRFVHLRATGASRSTSRCKRTSESTPSRWGSLNER